DGEDEEVDDAMLEAEGEEGGDWEPHEDDSAGYRGGSLCDHGRHADKPVAEHPHPDRRNPARGTAGVIRRLLLCHVGEHLQHWRCRRYTTLRQREPQQEGEESPAQHVSKKREAPILEKACQRDRPTA